MSKKPNIVQLTNDYIDNANQEQRLERAEHEQRNRFMGWILFVVVLLFILPTYNLVETYMNIKQQEKEVLSLQKDYDKLSDQTKEQETRRNERIWLRNLRMMLSPRNMRVLSTIIHVKESLSILYQAYYPNERFTKNCRNFFNLFRSQVRGTIRKKSAT